MSNTLTVAAKRYRFGVIALTFGLALLVGAVLAPLASDCFAAPLYRTWHEKEREALIRQLIDYRYQHRDIGWILKDGLTPGLGPRQRQEAAASFDKKLKESLAAYGNTETARSLEVNPASAGYTYWMGDTAVSITSPGAPLTFCLYDKSQANQQLGSLVYLPDRKVIMVAGVDWPAKLLSGFLYRELLYRQAGPKADVALKVRGQELSARIHDQASQGAYYRKIDAILARAPLDPLLPACMVLTLQDFLDFDAMLDAKGVGMYLSEDLAHQIVYTLEFRRIDATQPAHRREKAKAAAYKLLNRI